MTVFEKVLIEIKAFSDNDIKTIWRALQRQSWTAQDERDPGLTMDDWARLIRNEMTKRNLF